MAKLLGIGLVALLLEISAAAAPGPANDESRLAFAAYRRGQWDLFSLTADGSDLRQLTNDRFEETDPAFSPDGTRLAFASRREQNWDLYILDLTTGEETRLTNHPAYDGAPSWSPDGRQLAFESYRAGDLDIWRLDLETGALSNLTEDSPAAEFAPAWSPDGRSLAFTSSRLGDKDLWLLDLSSGDRRQLTQSSAAEEWPAWHPAGNRLAFVRNTLGEREVFVLDLAAPDSGEAAATQITWLGRTDAPVWNPDGTALAAVFHRYDGEQIVALQPELTPGRLPDWLTGTGIVRGRLTWAAAVVAAGEPVAELHNSGPSPLYVEDLSPSRSSGGEPYDLVRLNDLETGIPWLADTVDDSYQALRTRLRQEVGYDFLGEVSETLRPLNFFNDASQYASWHKSGRAVDTLFDLTGADAPGGAAYRGPRLEIVREEYGGETFWRLWLRCTDQTGRCGRPLTMNTWDWSYEARNLVAPEQGGVEKGLAATPGYYVDFTALAHEYGWERISSHDDEDYSWTWHFKAFEYWHYQKTLDNGAGETDWYQAMLEVYPRSEVESYFTWDLMRRAGEDPHLIALKGVPLPVEVEAWWSHLVR